jgi:hypothetical protein
MGGSRKRPVAVVFRILVLAYVVALIVSHISRSKNSFQFPGPEGQVFAEVSEMKGVNQLPSKVSMAYLDLEASDPGAPVIVLLHGSPVASSSLMRTANALK